VSQWGGSKPLAILSFKLSNDRAEARFLSARRPDCPETRCTFWAASLRDHILCWSGTAGFSQLGQDDALLALVFALLVLVADFRGLVSLEKQDLAKAFVGIDTCG